MSTKKPRVSFVLSEEIKEELERLASKHKRSVSNYLQVLVEQAIEQDKKESNNDN